MSNNYLAHLQYLNAGIELKKSGKDFNIGNLFVSRDERLDMFEKGLIDNTNEITNLGRQTFIDLKTQNLPQNFISFAKKSRLEKENPSLTARRPQYEILGLAQKLKLLNSFRKQLDNSNNKLEIGMLQKKIDTATNDIKRNYLNERDRELLVQLSMEKNIDHTVKYKDNQSAGSPWKNSRMSRTHYNQEQSDKLIESYDTAEKLNFNADKLITSYLSNASRTESIRFLNEAGLIGIKKTSERSAHYEKIKNHEVFLTHTGEELAENLTLDSMKQSRKKDMELSA